jgi:hypothetical protein
LVLSILSNGCGKIHIPVDIKDETLTYIKGDPNNPATFSNYAVQMHFLSQGQVDLTKSQVDAISQGSVLMPEQAFEDFNTEIAKACSQLKCNYELTEMWSSVVAKIRIARTAEVQ